MVKPKTETAKRRILRRVRRQRLKYITVLPSLITLLNGICGFAAIGFAAKAAESGQVQYCFTSPPITYFAMAGYLIFVAMLADMLDGRLARMSQSTSSFGGQLDSLCDMISFGIAPAFLMLKVLELKLTPANAQNHAFTLFLGRFIWLTAAAYISCVAIRLARFNVENEEDETMHMSFWGLPTPAAAGVIASIIIFYQDMLPALASKDTGPYIIGEKLIIITLPFVAIAISALMVSRIRYPHILNQYLRGKKPFAYLLRVVLVLVLIILNFEAALVLVFCGFALSGFAKWFYYKVISKKGKYQLYRQPPVLTITGPEDSPEQNNKK